MKLKTLLILGLSALVIPSQAQTVDPNSGGSGQDGLVALYATRINPSLSISSQGSGIYKYTFDFINTDSSPIWDFGVFARTNQFGITGTFQYQYIDPVSGSVAEYNPSNVDPTMVSSAHMNYGPFTPPATGLAIGGSGELSFETSGLYSSFIYYYETLNSGFAVQNGGDVAAFAVIAVPEPSSLALAGFGSLASLLVYRRRQ